MNQQKLLCLQQLQSLLAFPSISADSSKKEAVKDCAIWISNHLKNIGLQAVKVYTTTKFHPIIYAEYIHHPSYKTILFYGHYDVQPVDPIKKWKNPPFEPVIQGDYLFGRGASDDKGQLFIHIKAVEQLLKKRDQLHVNIKFLLEGAEEIGSLGLDEFILKNKELLKCDVAVVSDTKMASLNGPAITYSLRGALNAEIFIQSAKKDLHSGTFGGGVPNAAYVISELICKLHRRDNTIAIPGFYNDVMDLSEEERRFMQINGVCNNTLLKDAEATRAWGEKGFTLYERTTIRPSLSVTGITSGFQGEGVKNVIPSSASVKLNFRLVPDQNPEKIQLLLNDYIGQILPPDVALKTVYSSFANPVMVSRKNPYIVAAANAYENIFQRKVKFIRAGGTIPAVDYLSSILKIPVVLMGFAQASDNMHAPDERFYLPNFFRGIDTITNFIINVGKMKTRIINNTSFANAKINSYARY